MRKSIQARSTGVMKTRRDGRKIILIMRNGLEHPVSRSHQDMVKARFLV